MQADKSTIVEEAVKYIKRVEQNVEELEKRKLERYNESFVAEEASPNPGPVFKTWTSPNVILNVCGRDGHMNVCSMRKPGLLAALCFVMEKHHLQLVTAQASSHRTTCIYMIHARANGDHPFPIQQTFQQAAAEMMLWVNS